MTERTRASWLVYVLGALCAGAIAAAILVVGPASGSQRVRSRTVTAASGVVQSTVSGSGNLQAASQLNLGFKTSGTVTHIYVTQGAAGRPGPAGRRARPAERRSDARTGEGQPAGRRGQPRQGGRNRRRKLESSGLGRHERQPARAQRDELHQASSTSSSPARPERGHARSEPGIRAGGRPQRRADGPERRSRPCRTRRLYAPEDGTIVSLSGEVGEIVSARARRRASSASSSSGGSGSAPAAQRRPPRALARSSGELVRLSGYVGLLELRVRGAQRPQLDAARGAAERIRNRQRQGRPDRHRDRRSARRPQARGARQRSRDPRPRATAASSATT